MQFLLLLPLFVTLTLAQDDVSTTPWEETFFNVEQPDPVQQEPVQPEQPEAPIFMPGGWYPFTPTADNPALKFALDAGKSYLADQGYNGKFELVKILPGSTQTVAGYNYKITVKVKSGCKQFKCSFDVFQSLWNGYSLRNTPRCDVE